MKNRFTIQIRGNVDHVSQEELQKQMQAVLATFPDFKMTFSSVEVWQNPDGNPRKFNDDGTEYTPMITATEKWAYTADIDPGFTIKAE